MAIQRTDVAPDQQFLLFDLDRGTFRRSPGGFNPQWSPDGRTIITFMSGGLGIGLYRRDAIGAASNERLGPWPTNWPLTDWSRDGRLVLNTRKAEETLADLWVVPVTPDGDLAANEKATPYLRTSFNEMEGRFSPEPNPRWVAYQSDDSGRDEIYVQSFPEPRGPHRISTNGGRSPQWGPGGRELFYQSLDGKVMAVSLKLGADSVEPSAPRELFALPPRYSLVFPTSFQVTPDGQRFLVLVPDPTPRPLTVLVNWPALMKPTAKQ
jgi:Tol biopolymer transport system component